LSLASRSAGLSGRAQDVGSDSHMKRRYRPPSLTRRRQQRPACDPHQPAGGHPFAPSRSPAQRRSAPRRRTPRSGAVGRERERGRVAELRSDVVNRASLREQQRSERVPQVVRVRDSVESGTSARSAPAATTEHVQSC
jgi:hypothetical protein